MYGLLIAALLLAPGGYPRPTKRARVSALSSAQHRHVEILRIDRDFHDSPWGIVLDGWVARRGPPTIDQLNLWWVKEADRAVRRPFKKDMDRFLEVLYEPVSDTKWTVKLVSDHKEFAFEVELDETGRPRAYVNARMADGVVIPHCRATWSKIQARRFLGIPVGVKRLSVVCIDAEGKRRRGVLPYRRVR